jgi:hypothetical protein
MFENSAPGLREKAAAEDLDPLAYMRRYGVVEISRDDYGQHELEVTDLDDTVVRSLEDVVTKRRLTSDDLPLMGRPDTVATMTNGVPLRGFTSLSRKLEMYSKTLAECGQNHGANARDAFVFEHLEIALLALLEQLADPTGDTATADAARLCKAQDETMAATINGNWTDVLSLTLASAGLPTVRADAPSPAARRVS